ncbi:hypothetical protein [Acetobacter ascendens]|uniref:hypothetical protein n=1 Tax=Acetobacter ascendens TaxID=481146 RepID=UPI000F56B39A|nr:hypothetical protein [Acetobacter ascendens]
MSCGLQHEALAPVARGASDAYARDNTTRLLQSVCLRRMRHRRYIYSNNAPNSLPLPDLEPSSVVQAYRPFSQT